LFSFPPPLGARRLLGILSDARAVRNRVRADRFANPAPVFEFLPSRLRGAANRAAL
jgi:hypothetical protein